MMYELQQKGTTVILSEKQADVFVRKTAGARWDGWKIIIHKTDPVAEYRKQGKRIPGTNVWGFETQVDINQNGQWVIPSRRR